ncbi:MAG TPA: alpha/beta hydrolase [Caulobacteraceae bacterium]|nr:alpha/beta hydrolase [Caulobacteraceae bacterium]
MGEACEAFPRFKTDAGKARYRAAYEAALKDWPVPFEALDIETALGPTHVIASGPAGAPQLVLLPSFAGTALSWRPNIAALAQRHRCYAVDVIGQPGLSLARRRLERPDDYAPWMAELLDGLGVARAAFVGCSFGGFLAARQALWAPERVERVALVGPPGVFAAMSWRVALTMGTARLRRRVRRALGDKREPNARALHARGAPQHPEDDGWRKLMGVTMAESPEVSVTQAPVFTAAQLRRITAPMLLLVGAYEQLYEPAATISRARRLKPGIEAEIVPGADHIAAMAQPEWVNARLARFLEGD